MTEHCVKPVSFFVAVHKDAPLPPPRDNYFALGIGGYHPRAYPFAFSDDTGESIWRKNTHYSELTGWYWIWKNLRDVNVLGLCHYRRYFLFDNKWFLFFRRRKRYFYPTPSYFNYITAPERTAFVEKALSKYDVIIPQRIPLDASISQNYANCHVREDWDLFIQGIEALYPQYSSEIGWFDKTSYIHPYNMMVAPRAFFDEYMSSLFPLLFWMEKNGHFEQIRINAGFPRFYPNDFSLIICT